MKKLVAFMMLMAVVAVAPVFAAGGATMRANVPFDFVLNGKALPAGEYEVADSMANDMVYVRALDGKASAIAMTQSKEPAKDGEAAFVFNYSGGTHYLVGTQRGGVARELPRPAEVKRGTLAFVKAVLR